MVSFSLISYGEEQKFDYSLSAFQKEYFEFAKDVIEKYHRNKDIFEENSFPDNISENALKLFNTKIKLGHILRKYGDEGMNDYQIEILPSRLSEWREDEDEIFLMVQVIRSWRYNGLDTRSAISDVQEVTLRKDQGGLVFFSSYDFLVPDIMLGPVDEIFKSGIAESRNFDAEVEKYISDFEESRIKRYLEQKEFHKEFVEKDKFEGFVEVQNLDRYLNRDAIKTWVRNNYNKNEPESSTSTVPYYDFSEIPGNFDRTNFVSHALLAGGASMHDDGGVGTDQWYYRNLSNRSSSWAV